MPENAVSEAPEAPKEAPQGDQKAFEPITSQEQLDSLLSARLARQAASIRKEYGDVDELREAAEKWKAEQEAKKSELDKATERANALEAELKQTRLEAMRAKIAADAKLPPALAARLAGETEADMKADAEALAELLKPASSAPEPTGIQSSSSPAQAGGVIASLFKNR